MTMGVFLAEQAGVFFQAMAVGAVFGAFYDVFRISRLAIPTHAVIVFVEDVLFFLVCAVVTFLFGLTVIDGALRLFVILGVLCGGIIYYRTLGVLVIGAAKRIIEAIRAVFRFITRKILYPFWLLLLRVSALFVRPCIFMLKKFLKYLQKAKICLKNIVGLLYNHIQKGLSHGAARVKAGRLTAKRTPGRRTRIPALKRKNPTGSQKGKAHEKTGKEKKAEKTR